MKHLFLLFTLATALRTEVSVAQNSIPQNILFIFDASGSMWAKLGSSTKIQAAKETMGRFSEKIPAGSQVGLIAYGHNSASDCNDIELLLPMDSFDQAAFYSRIKSLNPKGKTPIARSVSRALEVVKGRSEPVTIILVSDGLETCEGNACELVQEAKTDGVSFTFHVVGFGITEKDLSPLECIAQAGGGQYFTANNAGELMAALEKTVEQPKAGDAYLSVRATLAGKLTDATIKVKKSGSQVDVATGRTYESPLTNPRLLQLASGTYDVWVESVTIQNRPTVKLDGMLIASNDTLYKEIMFDQGIVEVLVTRNGNLSDATVQLYQAGTNSMVTTSRTYTKSETNPVRLNVPPGKYDLVIASVEISGKPERKYAGIELGSSDHQTFSHNFESGVLSMGARKENEYADATVTIVNSKTGKQVASGRTYQDAASNPKKFILEPGNYRVELKAVKPAGLGEKSVDVEIPANGLVEKIVVW